MILRRHLLIKMRNVRGENQPEQELKEALRREKKRLEEVEVPVLTVSGSFRKEMVEEYEAKLQTKGEVVFSRGHYSEAVAVVEAAKRQGLSSYLVDPMNFVSKKDWGKLEMTEEVGELVARYKMLASLKRVAEQFLRGGLPISEAIKPVVMELIENIEKPIIAGHYEVGNIIAKTGKKVVQMVTDPYVSEPYLKGVEGENISWVVFDEETKEEFIEKAGKEGKKVDEEKIRVTGPAVHPEILKVGREGKSWGEDRPLRLAITTGGLGTNKGEIKKVLDNLTPLVEEPEMVRLFLYGGMHKDFRAMFEGFAEKHNIRIGDLDNKEARLRVLYEDSLVDGNRNIIEYMFPWADGVVTKPSGDMAYDVLGSGAFGLYLDSWGKWEEAVRERMIALGVGERLNVDRTGEQIMGLREEGILAEMMKKASLWARDAQGAARIVAWQQEW